MFPFPPQLTVSASRPVIGSCRWFCAPWTRERSTESTWRSTSLRHRLKLLTRGWWMSDSSARGVRWHSRLISNFTSMSSLNSHWFSYYRLSWVFTPSDNVLNWLLWFWWIECYVTGQWTGLIFVNDNNANDQKPVTEHLPIKLWMRINWWDLS